MSASSSSASSSAARLIAKGAGIVFVGAATGSILRYLFQVIVARRLGAEVFGLWTLGFIVFKIMAMAAEFGLPQGIVRYVAAFRAEGRDDETRSLIRSGLRLGLFSGLAAMGLMFALASPVANLAFRRPELAAVIRLFAAAVPPVTLVTLLLSVTQGLKTMIPTVAIRDFLEPLFRVLLAVGAFLFGLGIAGATLSYILGAAAAMFLAWAAVRRLGLPPARSAAGSGTGRRLLLSFGWPLFFVQVLSFIIQWTGTILLGLFATPADVGIYGVAVKTALLGSLSRNAFHSIFSPVVAEFDRQRLSQAMGVTYRTVSKWVFSLNLPLFLALAVFGRPALRLFGGEFEQGRLPLAVLGLGWVFYSAVGPVGETLIMTGRQRLHLLNMIGTFAANLGLCLWLVPAHGALGAAAATAASMILYSLAAVLQVRFIVGLKPFPRTLWKPVAAGTAAAGIVLAGGSIRGLSSIFTDLPAGLAGGAVLVLLYFGFLFLFGLDEEDRRILALIRSRILPVQPAAEEDS